METADANGEAHVDGADALAEVAVEAGPWSLSYTPSKVAIADMIIATVETGDVTGDGRADVVVAGVRIINNNQVVGLLVFPQTMNGTLGAPDWYPGPASSGLCIGDLDGDGDQDIALVGGPGLVVVPQTNGKLGQPVHYDVDGGNEGDRCALADFNGDKALDVVQSILDGVAIWLQTKQGFVRTAAFDFGYNLAGFDRLVAGDVTGDALDDVVFASGVQGVVAVLAQNGNASVANPINYAYTMSMIPGADGLAIGDVTGDKLLDVVVAYGGNNPKARVAVLPQTNGALGAPAAYMSLDIPGISWVSDMDGDGKNDVVVAHEGWNQVGIYLQDANGKLLAEKTFKLEVGHVGRGHSIAVADLNADGHPDVVAADYYGGGLLLLTSN